MPNHVSLAFAQIKDARLIPFAEGVHAGISGNALVFTNFPATATMAMLETAKTDFETKLQLAVKGSEAQTQVRNDSCAALILLLRILATYVEGVALGDAAKIRLAGFEVVTHVHTPATQLDPPVIKAVLNGITTQLKLRVIAVAHAAAYEAQYRVGTGAWQAGGSFTDSRAIMLTGMIPGTLYEIRVRAVGGSTGYSNWSDSVNHMAT